MEIFASNRPVYMAARRAKEALGEINALDKAMFSAIVDTPTPTIDAPLRALSQAANHGRLWIGAGACLSLTGRQGRRAALCGLGSLALASATANLLVKQWAGRSRPLPHAVAARHVPVPRSSSFPSGHAASAFAFAVGAGSELPVVALPLNLTASLVAYSRIHGGVHYPSDVVAGAALGSGAAVTVSRLTFGRRRHRVPA